MILLDTCALIDLISEKPTLSKKTLDLIDQGAVLLSISFAEIACKVAANKLILHIDIETLLQRIDDLDHFKVQDITPRIWLNAIQLSWHHQGKPHKDPADRLILSYAEHHQLPLATTDMLMRNRYERCVW